MLPNLTMNIIWEGLIRLSLGKKRPKNQSQTKGVPATCDWCSALCSILKVCFFGHPVVLSSSPPSTTLSISALRGSHHLSHKIRRKVDGLSFPRLVIVVFNVGKLSSILPPQNKTQDKGGSDQQHDWYGQNYSQQLGIPDICHNYHNRWLCK